MVYPFPIILIFLQSGSLHRIDERMRANPSLRPPKNISNPIPFHLSIFFAQFRFLVLHFFIIYFKFAIYMTTLNVPQIKNLEKLPLSSLKEALETKGGKGKIDLAPWEAFPYKPQVTFDLAAGSLYLFINFNVEENDLKAEFSKTNEPVWQDSCVEFFVADPDGKGYRNFEINCIGTLLSAHQQSKGVGTVHISEEDADKILRYPSLKSVPFKLKEGVHQWNLIVGIPWTILGYDRMPESIRANFYKCADGSRNPHYLCWAPIDTPDPDFHRPEYFGTLTFHTSPS